MKLIKIGADWCQPCKELDKRLANFNKCPVIKYYADNEDEETEKALEKYNVRNIPVTILEDDNGNIIKKWTGLVNIKDIEEEIDKNK